MNEFRRPGLALACLTMLLCLGAAAPKVSQTPQDLVGSWKLNEDLSQDPRAMRPGGGDRGARGGGPPPGGGPRGGGRGGRPGPPPGGGFGGGEDSQRPPGRGQIVAMAGGAMSLLIEVDGPQLTLTSGDDDRLFLFTDGRKVRTEQEEGSEKMVRRTRWRDEHLEIETTTDRGKITELWILTNDRQRIFATVEMGGGRRKMSFKRVWDRVESEKAEASPAR